MTMKIIGNTFKFNVKQYENLFIYECSIYFLFQINF